MIPSWVAVVTGISLAILALAAIAIALSSVIAVLALRAFLRLLEQLAGPAAGPVRQLAGPLRREAARRVAGLEAGHARLTRRVGASGPARVARGSRRPAAGVPLRLSVRQHRGGHLAREEIRAGGPALPLLARRPGDLRPRADRS